MKLTMPSLSLLMPWSKTLSRALSNAPCTSPSGGPSRINRSKDIASAALEVLFNADLCRLSDMAVFAARFMGEGASLLARCLCGDRLETCLRVGEISRACRSRSLCWEINDGCAGFLAAAPRLWADCSLRSARCVRGDGGAWSSVMRRDGARFGMDSLVGLGIVNMERANTNYIHVFAT